LKASLPIVSAARITAMLVTVDAVASAAPEKIASE